MYIELNVEVRAKTRLHNVGIKHIFSCINVCQVTLETLKPDGEARGFEHLPKGPGERNTFKNNAYYITSAN